MKGLLFALLFSANAWGLSNLTIASASVAADGQTFTLTMSAGALVPASGIGGCFVLHGGNVNALVVGSGTSSGTTVTFQSAEPFNAEDSPTIDILTAGAGCNLASSGNTPQGQSGVAVSNASEWHSLTTAPMTTYARYEGGAFVGIDPQGSGHTAAQWNSADGSLSVNADGSSIQIWAFQFHNAFSLYQDGVTLARATGGTSTTWGLYNLSSGLSGTHLYKIVASDASVPWQGVYISQVRFVGGGPRGPKPAGTLPVIGWCGDSITNLTGGGSAPNDTTGYDQFLTAYSLGAAAQGWSASGAGVSTGISTNCPSRTIPADGSKLAELVLQAGRNDAYAGTTPGNPSTPGTFEGDFYSMIINSAPNIATGGTLLIREFMGSFGVSPGTRTAYTEYEQTSLTAARTTLAGDYPNLKACYYHTDNWIDISSPGAYPADTLDGNHPNESAVYPDTHAAGRVANLEAPVLYGNLPGKTSYSITGPSSGTVGSALTYTVTLANGAGTAFVASPAETISLSDGGQGGALSSLFGGGTSTAMFTPTSGSSFTFTYTPAASGTITLAASNAQDCWTNPAAVPISVSSATTSKSLQLTGILASNSTIPLMPANRLEFYLHDWNIHRLGSTHLIGAEGSGATGWVVYLSASDMSNIVLFVYNSWEVSPIGAGIQLGTLSTPGVYVRAQHDTTHNWDLIEAWDVNGNLIKSETVPFTPATPYGTGMNISDFYGSVGPLFDIGWLRVKTDLVPLNSRMPAAVDTNPSTRVFEWRFDNSLLDDTSNHYDASLSTPGAAYVTTPYTKVQSVIGYNANELGNIYSMRAGYPAALDGSKSLSQSASSSLVTCFWQQLSGPNLAALSSHTSCTPTLSGTVFGDYAMQLTVTDAESATATSMAHIGAVAADDNGVVINANPLVDTLFGGMIAFGKNPWTYADYWHLHAHQLRAVDYNVPAGAPGGYWVTPDANQSWSAHQWEQTGSGTVDYSWNGTGVSGISNVTGAYPGTTLHGPIGATDTAIVVTDAARLDLREFPTRILINTNSGDSTTGEEVRICSVVGNTLTACFDGRGKSVSAPAQAWSSGTSVGQFKVTGTGTHFLTDANAAICPLANQISGPSLYTGGTVTLTPGSTTVMTTGDWPSTFPDNQFGTIETSFLSVAATHGGTPFQFNAQLATGGALAFARYDATGTITGAYPHWYGAGYTSGQVNVTVPPYYGCTGVSITANVVSGSIASYTVVSPGSGCSNPKQDCADGGNCIWLLVDPTTVTLTRPYPANADSITTANYNVMKAQRTMVLRSNHATDTTGTGEVPMNTTGCESETAAYGNPWSSVNNTYLSAGLYGNSFAGIHDTGGLNGTHQTGYPYSVTDTTSWANSMGGEFFYGESLAHRSLYYRSGLQSAKDAADSADYFLKSPYGNRDTNGFAPLVLGGPAIGGFVSTILGGSIVSWSDLRGYAASGEGYANTFWNGGTPICNGDDTRNSGYGYTWLTLAAMYDPDTSSPSTCANGCRARWQADLAKMQGSDAVCKDTAVPYVPSSANSWANAAYYFNPTNTCVIPAIHLTHGSTAATGTGLVNSCAFGTLFNGTAIGTGSVVAGSSVLTVTSGTLPTSLPNNLVVVVTGDSDSFTGEYLYSGSTSPYTMSVLWPGATETVKWMAVNMGSTTAGAGQYGSAMAFGLNNADYQNLSHNYQGIYNSSSSVTLDHPWSGADGTYVGNTGNITGLGQQAFMLGIKTYGMGLLAGAGAIPGLSGYAATSQTLLNGATQWIHDEGIDAPTGTVNYGRVFGFCEPTTIASNTIFDQRTPGCNYGTSHDGKTIGREQVQELGNAISLYYRNNPTSGNKAWGDNLMSGVWGTRFNTSGVTWDSDSDANNVGQTNLADQWIHGNKWLGFFAGVGNLSRWPAERLGGVAPVEPRTVYVPFTLSAVPNAAKVQITVTQPTGTAATLICATSPCAIGADARAGSVLMKIDYLDSSGAVIATGDTMSLYVPK